MTAGEAVEHGGDVGLRVEAVQPRGLGDGVDDGGPVASGVGAEEQVVLARAGYAAQQPLGKVVVD